jgi:hypothetical protein
MYLVMENVGMVKHLLPVIQSILDSFGYNFFASGMLDPTSFGCPNSRPRRYFGGTRKGLGLVEGGQYNLAANAAIKRFIHNFAREAPVSLENFMLDMQVCESYYKSLVVGFPDNGTDGHKWQEVHDRMFQSCSMERPTAAMLSAFVDTFPDSIMKELFIRRSLREQEVAFYSCVVAPRTGPEVVVDLSQQIDRINLSSDVLQQTQICCFTSRSVPWLIRSRRFLTGRERLSMHGMSAGGSVQTASDSLLADLAGNSFSATCFLVAFISGLQ